VLAAIGLDPSLHLAEISRNAAPGAHADGAGYHIAADLKPPPNITLVSLPYCAPELNPMENVWQYLRGNKPANTVFRQRPRHSRVASDAWMFAENDTERIATTTTRSSASVNI
jgi:hypothetical protein